MLNAWLRDQGYFVQVDNSPAERSAELNWILVQWLQNYHKWSGRPEKISRRLAREILFKLPNSIEDRFWTKVESIIPFAREHVFLNGKADFACTQVFPGSVYSGLLYLNIVGREPAGVITHAEREDLAAEIATKLLQIEDPATGHPLFSNAYTPNDIYTGASTEYAPDLILDSYGSGWNVRTSKHIPIPELAHNKYFLDVANRKDFGWHSRQGIFVFSGPAFSVGPAPLEGHVMDIPAALLHLYGVPVPEDYDGRVLIELMAPEIRRQPIHSQPGDILSSEVADDTLSIEEAREVIDRLRALGYTD